MKFLIVLSACLVSCLAGGDDCMAKANDFKNCLVKDVTDQSNADMEQLKKLGGDLIKCFSVNDNVKANCKLQRPQMPSQGAASPKFDATQFKIDPAQAQALASMAGCLKSAGDNFQACAQRSNIQLPPMDPPGQGPEGHPLGQPPMAGSPMHAQFFPDGKIDFKQIQDLALSVCGNKSDSARALLQCALTTVVTGHYLPVVARFIEPRLTICASGKKCEASNPISNECVAKFQSDRAALCACKTEAEAFFNQDAKCDSTRAKIEELKRSADSNAVSQARPLPSHPEIDICGVHENPQAQCDALEKKVNDATGKIEQMVAALNAKKN